MNNENTESSWRTVKMAEIAATVPNSLAIGPFGSDLKTTDYTERGVPVVFVKNVRPNAFRPVGQKFVSDEKAELLAAHRVTKGDLIVTKMGLPPCVAAIYPDDAPDGIVTADIIKLTPNLDSVDPRFISYFLNSTSAKAQVAAFTNGVTRPKVTLGAFRSMSMPLPPLAEQNRIADILDKAGAIRSKRQEAALAYARCIPSLFSEMFGFIVTNTKNWPVVPFGDACDSRLGKMLDAKQQTGEHLRPYLRNTNVQWNRFSLNEVSEMDFNVADREEFRLLNGDLLVCEGGEVGRAAIWRDELPECYFQKALHRVRPKPDMAVPEYVLHFLWQTGRSGGFGFLTSQATIAHLTGVKLKQLPLPLPPIELQQEFASRVNELERGKAKYAEAERETDGLFNSLIQRAFKGEL